MTETFAEKPAPDAIGERRQVTALFYDIVGSTSLLSILDPEDFGIAQRRIHSEASAVLRRYCGYLDRVLGDGGCAYFGYPVPTEDAAEAAVSCALELVERCRSFEASGGSPELQIRVGVATGIAVLNSTQGTNLPGAVEIISLAPSLAARLQAEAEPNSVLVSHSTHQLTAAYFDFQYLGIRDLKGFSEPQRLWRPVTKRLVTHRFSALRRPDSPLVGRSDELDLCRRRWARATEGRGQAIFMVGEAGIGKSRLVAEVLREAAQQDAAVHVFQCQPRGNTRPLHPVLDRLRREIATFTELGSKPDRRSIRDYIRSTAPAAAEASANIISFLLEAERDLRADDFSYADLSTEEFRRQAVAAVTEVLTAWSRLRPQLVVLEDLHWADTLTQVLLSRLVDEISRLRVLLLVTTRDPVPADWLGDSHVVPLALSRLDAAGVPQVVEIVWAPSSPPAGLSAFIEEKSDGIPLFVEELAQLLKDRLGEEPSGPCVWEAILRKDGVATLRDLLSTRIADLGDARAVAQVASVIGRDFSYELLASILDPEISHARLDEHLQTLLKAGVLRRRMGEERLSLRFRHVLLQEAAYDSLLKSKRREVHDRIVRLVHENVVPELPDEIMAWHCEQAGRPLDAARYGIRAAEACAIRSATQEAERLLDRAEDHLARSASAPEGAELTLQLLAARGPLVMELSGKGSPEACAIYERGVTLCHERGVQDRERWFPLYWGWWFTSPDRNTKRERSQVLVQDLDKARDPEIRLQALHCAWAANFHAADYRQCFDCIEKGLALYTPERARISRIRYGGHDAKVCALGERAHLLWLFGETTAADESIDVALQWAEETGHIGSKCHGLDYAIMLRSFEGNFEEALRLSKCMRQIAETHEMPGVWAKSMIFAGWARAFTGSLAEGSREFQEGLGLHRTIGTDEDIPVYLEMQAQLFERAGDFQAGLGVLGNAIEHARATGNLVWLPELYRRRALLRHAIGLAPEGCQQDLEQALSLAKQQGAVALAGRALRDLERLGLSAPAEDE